MPTEVSGRDALKRLCAAGAGLALSRAVLSGQESLIHVGGHAVALQWTTYGDTTIRLQFHEAQGGSPLGETGALVPRTGISGSASSATTVNAGRFRLQFGTQPTSLSIVSPAGAAVQRLTFDAD